MKWTSKKIKNLRCRLGLTQSELARKLNCELGLISSWESETSVRLSEMEAHIDALTLLDRQAESAADQVFQSPLAESILDETRCSQVDSAAVKRRFFENN